MTGKQGRLTTVEEQHVQQAMKLIQQWQPKLALFRIRRMLEKQAGLNKQAAEIVMIEADKRLRQQKYAEAGA